NSHAAEAIRDLLYTETGSVSIWRQLQQFGWFILYKFVYGLKFIEDPDKFIPEEGEIQINGDSWRILHTPGHAPDHISLYNASKGVLFYGDNILRTVITWLGPPNSNIESYMKTLKKIRDLDNLKFIFPAHGGPVKNPKERIDEILEHRKSREELVYKIILNNPHRGISPSQILKTIYPGAGFSFYNIARGWVCLTLKLLEEKDKIYRKVGKHEFKFCPKKTI
ncbi:MAG: MBL fold metallo-hydrolase, partial [Promethearchaeia archaeon]